MSLLNHLWDDTLAGPLPESGLGKLRKRPTTTLSLPPGGNESSSSDGRANESVKVTRSIMIGKSPRMNINNEDGSEAVSPAPASPAGFTSTPPVSPFSGGEGRRDAYYRFRRKSLSDIAYEQQRQKKKKQKNRIRGGNSHPPFDV